MHTFFELLGIITAIGAIFAGILMLMGVLRFEMR